MLLGTDNTSRLIERSFAVRTFAGLGITDARARECMGYGEQRCTAAEIREAREFLYPAQTETGQLVSQQQIDTGTYEVVKAEGGQEVAIPKRRQVTSRSAGTKPEYEPPQLYVPENCGLQDVGCIERNTLRQRANQVLIQNASALYNRRLCEHANQLNRTNNPCSEWHPIRSVPAAPGRTATGVVRKGDVGLPADVLTEVYYGGPPAQPAARTQDPVVEAREPQAQPRATVQPGEITARTPPTAVSQITQGFQEVTGEVSEATGLSKGVLLAIAAAVGIYLVVK